ncbi:unnamed protein product [Paramecium primaurelia]|uniref:Uncharacterized protein n=1 Tax=Paramecium primaurelia TaxID=5886 RepID=A0A8S1MIE7_PARPR|nr:unnamed protein product [Paramecium primaurelia]
MNQNDNYIPLSYNDHNHPLQKWRLHSNSMHSQPLIKIDFDHKPKMQSYLEIPKKSRKTSKVSLNSLEVSPKIPKLNNSKDQKYKELSELHKSYSQFKKSLNQVKKQHLIVDNNCEINTINPNSSFYLNGVKLPYSLYVINKNRQMAITNLMNHANPHAHEQSQQQIQMIDNQIKKVRNIGPYFRDRKLEQIKNEGIQKSILFTKCILFNVIRDQRRLYIDNSLKSLVSSSYEEQLQLYIYIYIQIFVNFMITTPNVIDSKFYELQNSCHAFKSENEEFKQILLRLWIQISKSFNEDFEEILQLGINSDIQDVMNAILIIEEARLEQIKSDRQQIQLLEDELKAIKQSNTTNTKNEELIETQKQYRELSELVIQLKLSNEDKDHQILEQTKLNKKLQDEYNLLTSKINNLSLALVQSKEEKIQYMEQSQKEIKLLMEKELQQSKMIQILQIQKIELENMIKKTSQRNSVESSNHQNSQIFKDDEQTRILSCSPRTTHIDISKIVLQNLQNKKAEMVSGQSLSQIPYKFGK